MSPDDLSPIGKELFRRIEFDDDEKLVCEIRKHPVGLFMIYLAGLVSACVVFLLTILGATFMQGDPLQLGMELGGLGPLIVTVGIILTFVALVGTFIAGYLYKSNVVLVTSDKLAQILSPSLFHRKISQLSIGDVQDVTVKKEGIIAHFFNYGTIVVETAGEQQNYTFTFAPDPYEAGKAIVGTHENNLKLYGN